MDHTSGPILVGYDGSPDAQAALMWAIREAASRHLHLRVVYCEPDLTGPDAAAATLAGAPILGAGMPLSGAPIQGAEMPLAGAILGAATREARAAGVPAEGVGRVGPTAVGLLREGEDASMIVIGSRGLSSVSSAILGSTVAHVASHAGCPVIVAREQGHVDGPVVVGVDATRDSEETLGWAIDHASRHGLALEVLHAYAIPVYPGVVPYVPPVEISKATADFEDRLTHEVLAGWREKYPDVHVTLKVRHGRPGPILAEASERASLLVVGSHGRGAFLGMLLGSTSQSLLHHAHGSVAVLHHRRHR